MKRDRKLEKELKKLRPLKVKPKRRMKPLIEEKESWKQHWWGMPEFSMKDRGAQYKAIINFVSMDDVKEFQKATEIRLHGFSPKTFTTWYPDQKRLKPGTYYYSGEKTNSKYPICIPSKGRADCQLTGKVLDRMGVKYKFFVEETEYNWYVKYLGKKKVVKMPFHDLGKGSIPARNYIWRWCKKRKYKRHWTVDDNISEFGRTNFNRKLICYGGGFFRAMEDFVDRYENVAMAGPHHRGFIIDRDKTKPITWNSRVYSCILLDTSLYSEFKWRGRYNEDTDLSLRLLKAKFCTLLFRALYMGKAATYSGGNENKTGALKGGNTDNVYNTNDHRFAFAKSLQRQHPDVVKVVWKYNRWHHQVNYSKFKKNKPILRPDIIPIATDNNYGMILTKRKKKKLKIRKKK